jgi:hypothetical protein
MDAQLTPGFGETAWLRAALAEADIARCCPRWRISSEGRAQPLVSDIDAAKCHAGNEHSTTSTPTRL